MLYKVWHVGSTLSTSLSPDFPVLLVKGHWVNSKRGRGVTQGLVRSRWREGTDVSPIFWHKETRGHSPYCWPKSRSPYLYLLNFLPNGSRVTSESTSSTTLHSLLGNLRLDPWKVSRPPSLHHPSLPVFYSPFETSHPTLESSTFHSVT